MNDYYEPHLGFCKAETTQENATAIPRIQLDQSSYHVTNSIESIMFSRRFDSDSVNENLLSSTVAKAHFSSRGPLYLICHLKARLFSSLTSGEPHSHLLFQFRESSDSSPHPTPPTPPNQPLSQSSFKMINTHPLPLRHFPSARALRLPRCLCSIPTTASPSSTKSSITYRCRQSSIPVARGFASGWYGTRTPINPCSPSRL